MENGIGTEVYCTYSGHEILDISTVDNTVAQEVKKIRRIVDSLNDKLSLLETLAKTEN